MRRVILAIAGIVAVIVLGVGLVIAIASAKPNEIEISRQTTIHAPPERVFELIDDFHNWKRWAPQDVDDPTFARTFSGASQGVGAVSEFSGARQSGEGRMEIVKATAPTSVTIVVDFRRPFVAHNTNEFTIVGDGANSSVTWAMRGTNPFVAKVMSVFMDMNAVMGRHFEAGLANLKAVAETP